MSKDIRVIFTKRNIVKYDIDWRIWRFTRDETIADFTDGVRDRIEAPYGHVNYALFAKINHAIVPLTQDNYELAEYVIAADSDNMIKIADRKMLIYDNRNIRAFIKCDQYQIIDEVILCEKYEDFLSGFNDIFSDNFENDYSAHDMHLFYITDDCECYPLDDKSYKVLLSSDLFAFLNKSEFNILALNNRNEVESWMANYIMSIKHHKRMQINIKLKNDKFYWFATHFRECDTYDKLIERTRKYIKETLHIDQEPLFFYVDKNTNINSLTGEIFEKNFLKICDFLVSDSLENAKFMYKDDVLRDYTL